MGKMLGISAQSIRKDISLAGDPGSAGARYDVVKLKAHLSGQFGFGAERKALCRRDRSSWIGNS